MMKKIGGLKSRWTVPLKFITNAIFPDLEKSQISALLSGGMKTPQTVVEYLASSPEFSTLSSAIAAVGLERSELANGGLLTIFAPTNEAFRRLPVDTLTNLHLGKHLLSLAVHSIGNRKKMDNFRNPLPAQNKTITPGYLALFGGWGLSFCPSPSLSLI